MGKRLITVKNLFEYFAVSSGTDIVKIANA